MPEGTPNTVWLMQMLGAYVWSPDDVLAPLLPPLQESGWPFGWDRDTMAQNMMCMPVGQFDVD